MLEELELKIKYKFKNIKILEIALTHSSYSNELGRKNYERLEFLGDAVLELVISDLLYKKYNKEDEGVLSKLRSSIVSRKTLSIIAKNLQLANYIKLGKGEFKDKGLEKESILAAVLEAIFGAIYLDSNYNLAYKIIKKTFKSFIDNVFTDEYSVDYKTKLQELVQQSYKKIPSYCITKEEGSTQNKVFEVELDAIFCKTRAYGTTKKTAEQLAAKKALQLFGVK